MTGESSWSWASDWRCPKCGGSQPIEPGQDTRPISETHVCDPLALRRAERDDQTFAVEVSEHECVFVEEQEPSDRLILPPCLICGLTAMDALEQLRAEREAVARVEACDDRYAEIRDLLDELEAAHGIALADLAAADAQIRDLLGGECT